MMIIEKAIEECLYEPYILLEKRVIQSLYEFDESLLLEMPQANSMMDFE